MLIAESELNRAHLLQDWQSMTGEAQALANEARLLRTLVSAVATLVTSFAAFRRKKSAVVAGKPSWLQTILKGVGEISNLWAIVCASSNEARNK